MKKIFYLIALVSVAAILISGCSKSPSQSPASNSAQTGNLAGQTASGGDTQPGVPLTVTEPADGATLTDPTVAVKGRTVAGAAVKVNDEFDIADAQGNFSIPLDLEDGTNFIDVVASDENGNEGEVLLSVEVDQAAGLNGEISTLAPGDSLPLTVSQPKDNATVGIGEVVVLGKTSPQAIVSVGDQAEIAGDDGSFSITVSVEEGPNMLDVIASNDNGDEVEVLLLVNGQAGG
jgi:hypothetical protein